MDAEALRRQHAVELSQAELEANPYPVYQRLQREQPLAWVEKLGMWLATRHADVCHVLAHPCLLYTSDAADE